MIVMSKMNKCLSLTALAAIVSVFAASQTAEAASTSRWGNTTAFQTVQNVPLTVSVSDVSGLVGKTRSFSFDYVVGTVDSNGNVVYDMKNVQTTKEYKVTNGATYTIDGITSGEYVKMWITDSAFVLDRRYGIVEQFGEGGALLDNGMSLDIPLTKVISNTAYTLTFTGLQTENGTVYPSGGGTPTTVEPAGKPVASGQPLPGVLATVAVAGLLGAYNKRRKAQKAENK